MPITTRKSLDPSPSHSQRSPQADGRESRRTWLWHSCRRYAKADLEALAGLATCVISVCTAQSIGVSIPVTPADPAKFAVDRVVVRFFPFRYISALVERSVVTR